MSNRIKRKPGTDRAMLGTPSHERAPNDLYATVDTRCVDHLDKVWPLAGRRFIEPMAGYGDLIWQIEARGGICDGASDLIAHPGADKRIESEINALTITRPMLMKTNAVITNPPYTLLRQTVRHFLKLEATEWLVVLCRASQLHVRDMRPMLTGPQFYGVAPLPFRPIWFPYQRRKAGPRHEYAWFFWQPRWPVNGAPRLMLEGQNLLL